ncbi:hypothetical protein FS837_008729, partial [Tulasnella sp. UAMH 9824]
MIEGICKENDFDIQYKRVDSTDSVPVRRLPTMWDALKAAKARMNQQMDQLIARLARRWNLASSVHQLPVEVLAIIFKEFQPSSPHSEGSNSLFNLLLVCRAWYKTITAFPELWCSYDARMPDNIAQRVIDHSKPLPISVNWDTVHGPYGPVRRDLGKLLDLAIENSTRIKSLASCVPDYGYPDLRKLLKAPTPVLETLRVQIDGVSIPVEAAQRLEPFELSEGVQLDHLSLIGVLGPWRSPRLSNLKTLVLEGFAVFPSLDPLLGVLSGSQRLEALQIVGGPRIILEYRANVPAVLPHLKKLVLSDVASIFVATFLAWVYTPSCSHVEVKDRAHESSDQDSEAIKALDAKIWRPGNDQAAALVGGTSSNMISGLLDICIDGFWIGVERLEPVRGHCKLEFVRTDIPELAARLGATFSHLPFPPAVHLRLTHANMGVQNLVDLTPWSELLES